MIAEQVYNMATLHSWQHPVWKAVQQHMYEQKGAPQDMLCSS